MATQSIASQIRAIRGISLSAVGVALIVFGALGIAVVYLSEIPRMIAACLADYIGLIAQ